MNTYPCRATRRAPSRSAVPLRSAGTYDVYVVVKEPTPEKPQKNAPPQKMSLLKQTVEVPDLWNGELNTSSVIVAERIDPLPAPLTPQQQAERPYALGTMEIVPAVDTKFTKKRRAVDLPADLQRRRPTSDNKPDVSVEYNFYTTAGAPRSSSTRPTRRT